jgi:hypothetical protein
MRPAVDDDGCEHLSERIDPARRVAPDALRQQQQQQQ